MKALYLPWGLTTFVLGLFCVGMGLMQVSGIMDHTKADRWMFFVQEEGVTDRELAHRISLRLAKDVPRPLSGVLMAAGLVLMVNGGMQLALSASIRKSNTKSP